MGQATGHGAGRDRDRQHPALSPSRYWAPAPPLRGEETPVVTPLVPRDRASPRALSIPSQPAATQPNHGSSSFSTPPAPPAAASRCRRQRRACCGPAGYHQRKSRNATANLPAQPCYKSGSGGSAVRQSLPLRAPAPNVLPATLRGDAAESGAAGRQLGPAAHPGHPDPPLTVLAQNRAPPARQQRRGLTPGRHGQGCVFFYFPPGLLWLYL